MNGLIRHYLILFLIAFSGFVNASEVDFRAAGILVTTTIKGSRYLCLGQLRYGMKEWTDFGGCRDVEDATLCETAQRECFEESGLKINLLQNTPCVMNRAKRYCMFLYEVDYAVLKKNFDMYDDFLINHIGEGFGEHQAFSLIPLSWFIEEMQHRTGMSKYTVTLKKNGVNYRIRRHFFNSLQLLYKESQHLQNSITNNDEQALLLWSKKTRTK